jgi:rhodanese-related sulfurtransferase
MLDNGEESMPLGAREIEIRQVREKFALKEQMPRDDVIVVSSMQRSRDAR